MIMDAVEPSHKGASKDPVIDSVCARQTKDTVADICDLNCVVIDARFKPIVTNLEEERGQLVSDRAGEVLVPAICCACNEGEARDQVLSDQIDFGCRSDNTTRACVGKGLRSLYVELVARVIAIVHACDLVGPPVLVCGSVEPNYVGAVPDDGWVWRTEVDERCIGFVVEVEGE
jgi:hypothetical protein